MTYKVQSNASNAKMKRNRRGNEKRWNQLGEPFAHMLGGVFLKTKDWINRKITQAERRYKKYH